MELKIQICFSGNDSTDKNVHYYKSEFLFGIDHISNGRKIRIEQSFAIMCAQKLMCFLFLFVVVKFLYLDCVTGERDEEKLFHTILLVLFSI